MTYNNKSQIGIITFFVLGVIIIFFMSGCSINGSVNHQMPQNSNLKASDFFGGNTASNTSFFPSSFTTTTAADLMIGQSIMLFGTVSADGSISATRIMIGVPTTSLRLASSNATNTRERGLSGDHQVPNENRNGANNFIRPARFSTSSERFSGRTEMMIRGEIINKDDNSLIVKNFSGGSNIVFYSTQTEMLIFSPPTSSPAPLDVHSTASPK